MDFFVGVSWKVRITSEIYGIGFLSILFVSCYLVCLMCNYDFDLVLKCRVFCCYCSRGRICSFEFSSCWASAVGDIEFFSGFVVPL